MSDKHQFRSAHETWPVLARLPEVTVDTTPAAPALSPAPLRNPASTTSGFRFDPPQQAGIGLSNFALPHRERVTESAAPARQELPERRRHAQSMHKEPTTPETPPGAASRRASSILPRSDPFSPPQPGVSLATVVRFLTLVALFAAAATWAQSTILRPRTAQREAESPAPETRQDTPASANVSSTALPKSDGPLAATSPRVVVAKPNANVDAPSDSYFQVITPQPPQADVPALIAEGALPRIQTNDPGIHADETESIRPPAIARLPGIIQPHPDSNHVENQSSLH